MTIIVTDNGFTREPASAPGLTLDEALAQASTDAPNLWVDLEPDADPEALAPLLPHLTSIRIAFPSSADGRGFTIARRLRLMGFSGRLRAAGHVIADQYALARRAGFDEVEISKDLASRQPEPMWVGPTSQRAHDYQSRLRG